MLYCLLTTLLFKYYEELQSLRTERLITQAPMQFKYYEELQSLRTHLLAIGGNLQFKYYEELQSLRTFLLFFLNLNGSNITKNYNP